MDFRRSLLFPSALLIVFVGALAAQVVPRESHLAQEASNSMPLVLEGFVFEADGTPAAGSVVIGSAGGRAVTSVDGHYRFEVAVPLEARSLQVTAFGAENAGSVASATVALPAGPAGAGSAGVARASAVPPLVLAVSAACSPSWLPKFGRLPGTDEAVYCTIVFDDGTGPALYAGGDFVSAGGAQVNHVAKWDGASWLPLGAGTSGGFRFVSALAVYDDGSGPALYAGGGFTSAGGVSANSIAKWDGTSWSALGTGMGGTSNIYVLTLAVYDSGSGPFLYAGGSFTSAGGVSAKYIAKWNGSSWSAVGSGMNQWVETLTVSDLGGVTQLYAGGFFTLAGGLPSKHVARWNGTAWSPLGSGVNNGVDDYVYSLTAFDDGAGNAVYAGGDFKFAGGGAADRVAKWDGTSWSALGSGMDNGYVLALASFDDGGGSALYAGGSFSTAGGVPAANIAKWDGSSWSPLGSGTGPGVYALAVYDDGGGPALYAGGGFTTAGGVPANYIAKWNGSSWSPLGTGMNSLVYSLAAFDDGSGPALYAGGFFGSAGGVVTSKIARWNGASWSGVGGFSFYYDAWVNALAVYDDGHGPALYAGGKFTTGGSSVANYVAKWNGSSWLSIGNGMNEAVQDLAAFDDGNGSALYATGFFTTAGSLAANRIARWNGSSWSALGSGLSDYGSALTVFDDDTGPALYVGGYFGSAFDSGDSFLAKWGCPDTTPPVLHCHESIFVRDGIGSPPGEVVTFSVAADDDRDPAPDVVCTPPSGSFFSPGTTIVTCTATDAAGNVSTCQFAVTVARRIGPPH